MTTNENGSKAARIGGYYHPEALQLPINHLKRDRVFEPYGIGKWLNVPEAGFWHEDIPESISKEKKGKVVMKYKPSYGDKQREAQQRKKEEHLQSPELPTASTKKQAAEQSKMDENRPNK